MTDTFSKIQYSIIKKNNCNYKIQYKITWHLCDDYKRRKNNGNYERRKITVMLKLKLKFNIKSMDNYMNETKW